MTGTAAELSPEDRAFFSRVAEVITGNPFSATRPKAGSWIAPEFRYRPTLRERQFNAALDERLAALRAAGRHRLTDYRRPDRQLVAYASLFQVYIRLVEDLDRLIEEEAAAEEPAPVPFADSALGALRACGFSRDEALRYFGLFYQLRRAFHFIVASLVGESDSMRRLREALWNNVFTADMLAYDRHLWNRMEDFSSLLLGETGTGKGAAAAAIGRSGYIPFDPRKGRFAQSFRNTFIAANLSQFPETLIESELFGHSKGAFTGAVKDHRGLFERCSPHGSLFLDEIGDLSEPVQVKLLQVLQDRTFTPVGSYSEKRFSGRVIVATNRPLGSLRSDGRFRDDLFYRLCSDIIVVPPLRQRVSESPDELEHLTGIVITRILGADVPEVTARVLEALQRDLPGQYAWPGNVRELEQAVRRILMTGHYKPDSRITPESDETGTSGFLGALPLPMSQLAGLYCEALYARYGSYEAVARHTQLDRRTVKKYLSRLQDGEIGRGRRPS